MSKATAHFRAGCLGDRAWLACPSSPRRASHGVRDADYCSAPGFVPLPLGIRTPGFGKLGFGEDGVFKGLRNIMTVQALDPAHRQRVARKTCAKKSHARDPSSRKPGFAIPGSTYHRTQGVASWGRHLDPHPRIAASLRCPKMWARFLYCCVMFRFLVVFLCICVCCLCFSCKRACLFCHEVKVPVRWAQSMSRTAAAASNAGLSVSGRVGQLCRRH